MFTHGGTAETVEIKKYVPHCQLATHGCRCHFFFCCLKVQEQRFPKYWFSFTCLMPWFRSSLLWFLDALCSFTIARMRVGLKTQLRTYGCIAQFWWQIVHKDSYMWIEHPFVLGRFVHTTQTCKGLFSSNIPFFAEGRPDGARKYGKMRPIRPAWTRPNQKDIFLDALFFFHLRPSILFKQLAAQDQGEWTCSNPVYIPHKCRNVQMFASAAHCKKQAKVLYFNTICVSRNVQPRSFSYAPGSEWCVRVPDPTSDRTSTKRSHDLA